MADVYLQKCKVNGLEKYLYEQNPISSWNYTWYTSLPNDGVFVPYWLGWL